jgi:hypothetical protein
MKGYKECEKCIFIGMRLHVEGAKMAVVLGAEVAVTAGRNLATLMFTSGV